MPYCEVRLQQSSSESKLNNGVNIFYRTYGRGPTKVLLIIGLAGTHDSWGPQIEGLTGTTVPNDEGLLDSSGNDGSCQHHDEGNGCGVEVCAFDNRGMGQSSVPTKKSEYTTKLMALDAIAVMDQIGWTKAHVFGHSMGAMIACKLAAMAPDRVLSLALLNVTGGGFQCIPKFDRQTLSVAFRFLRAKTPEERAAVDLDTHYSREYLEEYVGSDTRRKILYQEYVKGISTTGMQSNYGFEGQINACWTHKMKRTEIEVIRSAGFLVSVIHGRYDIIAQIYYARKLAEKLYPVARMIDLHGGHLVSHERTEEVNQALIDLIKASEVKMNPYDWTNLPNKNSGGYFKTRTERNLVSLGLYDRQLLLSFEKLSITMSSDKSFPIESCWVGGNKDVISDNKPYGRKQSHLSKQPISKIASLPPICLRSLGFVTRIWKKCFQKFKTS